MQRLLVITLVLKIYSYLQMSLSLLFFVLLLRLISNLLISLDKSLKQQIIHFVILETNVCGEDKIEREKKE